MVLSFSCYFLWTSFLFPCSLPFCGYQEPEGKITNENLFFDRATLIPSFIHVMNFLHLHTATLTDTCNM